MLTLLTACHSSDVARAEILTLSLDSDASELQLSVTFRNVDDDLLPLEAQQQGTLTARFTGTVLVDITSGSIGILVQADAITYAGSFLPPGQGGSFNNPGPADLAGQVVNPDPSAQGFYAVRDMELEVASLPTTLGSDGQFALTNQLVFVSGERSFFTGTINGGGFTGFETATIIKSNAASTLGSFEQVGNQYVLTVPIEIPWPIGIGTTSLTLETGTLQGQLVAVVQVPEPTTTVMLVIGVVTLGTVSLVRLFVTNCSH